MITQEEMNLLVPKKLKELEEVYDIEVLWAIECGSRAWGFAAPDSDFDVRFIYKRKREDYLKLNPDRDVIELPIDDTWDVSGWDLDKTLRLLQKSNPSIYEWFQSPIRYFETGFGERVKLLLEEYFSEETMIYHYLNTAKRHVKDFLSGEEMIPKKYFYALRPILACRYVMTFHTAPPVLLDDLNKAVLPDELKGSLAYLLDRKINGPENEKIPPVKDIDLFLKEQIKELEEYLKTKKNKKEAKNWDRLNAFFLEEINTFRR